MESLPLFALLKSSFNLLLSLLLIECSHKLINKYRTDNINAMINLEIYSLISEPTKDVMNTVGQNMQLVSLSQLPS